jgi:hypothetical protein
MTTGVQAILRKLDSEPEGRMEVKFPPVTAGVLVRRDFRVLLAAAEMDGLTVDWREAKGFLDSVFLIQMTGRGGLLARHLRRMMALRER